MITRYRPLRILVAPLVILSSLIAGCATLPSTGTTDTVGVAAVRLQPEQHQNETVRWGGTVVKIENRADATWVEVVGYPLTRSGRPNRDGVSAGRFLAILPGFLDPVDYSAGRSITVSGIVDGSDTRKIGEADYTYPKVAVADHELWSGTNTRYSQRSRHWHDYYRYPYFGYYGSPGYSRFGLSLRYYSGSRYFRHGYRHFGYGGSRYGYRHRGHRKHSYGRSNGNRKPLR